jgi:hypothetical protein
MTASTAKTSSSVKPEAAEAVAAGETEGWNGRRIREDQVIEL